MDVFKMGRFFGNPMLSLLEGDYIHIHACCTARWGMT